MTLDVVSGQRLNVSRGVGSTGFVSMRLYSYPRFVTDESSDPSELRERPSAICTGNTCPSTISRLVIPVHYSHQARSSAIAIALTPPMNKVQCSSVLVHKWAFQPISPKRGKTPIPKVPCQDSRNSISLKRSLRFVCKATYEMCGRLDRLMMKP